MGTDKLIRCITCKHLDNTPKGYSVCRHPNGEPIRMVKVDETNGCHLWEGTLKPLAKCCLTCDRSVLYTFDDKDSFYECNHDDSTIEDPINTNCKNWVRVIVPDGYYIPPDNIIRISGTVNIDNKEPINEDLLNETRKLFE